METLYTVVLNILAIIGGGFIGWGVAYLHHKYKLLIRRIQDLENTNNK